MAFSIRQTLRVDAPLSVVCATVADLATYPTWVSIVERAQLIDGLDATWMVDLRSSVGPFTRSKRLRMTRATAAGSHDLVFVRDECDGRRHASWTMRVVLEASGSATDVDISLDYDGRLRLGPLERVVATELVVAGERLSAHLNGAVER